MRRQATIYVCRFDGIEFLNREDFQQHLLHIRQTRNKKYRLAKLLKGADEFCADCNSIEQLEAWLNYGEFLRDYAEASHNCVHSKAGKSKNFKISVFCVGDCSNSHSAPRGMPTNWGNRSTATPRSYPGIYCRISYAGDNTCRHYDCRTNDILKTIGICTGNGGGGDKQYTYDCTIWAAHFPKLYKNLLVNTVADKIGYAIPPGQTVEADP